MLSKLFFRKNVLSILFVALTLSVFATTYTTKTATDKNGFTYEYVENDPVAARIYTLNNGLKVYLAVNKDEPRIQVYIPVKAGSTYDPKETTGLAHYLEHLMFKGNSKIGALNWEFEKPLLDKISDLYEQHKAATSAEDKAAIYKQIDSISQIAATYVATNELDHTLRAIGADNTNAYTSYEETVYINDIPANALQQFMELESVRFSELTLRLFHTELEAVYEEFNMSQDRDRTQAWNIMMFNVFPNHPYGQQTTIGTAQHLKNPSMVNIHNYWNTYYVPNNMAICMMGDLDPDASIKIIQETWGTKPFKEVKKVTHPHEDPILSVVRDTVYGPNPELLFMAFRAEGLKSDDYKYITLIDFILNNGKAGLLDLDLVQQQKVLSANCFPHFMSDYGIHGFSGTPREGQTLHDVEMLILQEIEKIKKGDFDTWMIQASINNLKLEAIKSQESNGYADEFVSCFIHDISWQKNLSFLDDISKITKKELVAFANRFYQNNYVVVYKLVGNDSTKVKVDKPEITPIPVNRTCHSTFYNDFLAEPISPIEPTFIDYKTAFKTEPLTDSIDFSYIENKTNDLFSLYYIVEMGKLNNKLLPLAVNYLEYLGTSKYSASELQKEYFKFGLNFGVSTGDDQSYVYISGLNQSFEKGLQLIEQLMSDAQVDTLAYQYYVEGILKSRADSKKNQNSVAQALVTYGKFGENSPLRDILTEEELRSVNPKVLVQLIKDLLHYKHIVFYYGNKPMVEAKKMISKYHKPQINKATISAKRYEAIETPANTVYFVNYDMVQANIYMLTRNDKFSEGRLSQIELFNEYFGAGMSSIVFQELRESKALAYQAYTYYSAARKAGDYDMTYAFISTNAAKLQTATEAMSQLLSHMPQVEIMFNDSRDAVLNRIATNRITKSSIFFNFLENKKRGFDYDIRESIYNNVKTTDINLLDSFFNAYIANKNYVYLVMGNKNDINLKDLEKLGTVKELTLEDLFHY